MTIVNLQMQVMDVGPSVHAFIDCDKIMMNVRLKKKNVLHLEYGSIMVSVFE